MIAIPPKIELHCHLDGILDPEMIREIQREDPSFPIQAEALEKAYPIYDRDRFFAWWRYLDPIQGQLKYFYPILDKHIERLKAQNVNYSEITITAGDIPCDSAHALEEVAMLRERVTAKENGELQIEFLIGLARNKSSEQIESLADCILELYERHLIVGVSLIGPEIGYPVRPFQKTFARFHAAGVGITIHAGEWGGAESVWDALEYGVPNRIGHGVSLFHDPALIERFQEHQIHIEFCPTSNLKTGSIGSIKDHPVNRAKELGLQFSLNTDDPGPFSCNLAGEYQLLSTVFGFDDQDFQKIYTCSLNARFQPELRIPIY